MSERKRITIELDQDTYDRLNNVIPWGFRKHIVSVVLNALLDAVERDGNVVIGAVMDESFKLSWDVAGSTRDINAKA